MNRSKYIPESEMVDKEGACAIIKKGKRTFDTLKKQGKIIPCAMDGNKFLYRKSDCEKLRQSIIRYF